jgi:prepilin-type N-terminal cleavage/methylation domain-containing protein
MKNGFTLIELLSVLIILGIIGIIAVPKVFNVSKNAEKMSYEEDLKALKKAGTNYYLHHINDVPNYGTPRQDKPISILVTEKYATTLPSGCDGVFYIDYKNEEKYVVEVELTCDGVKYCTKQPCN